MALRWAFTAIVFATLLASNGPSRADAYKPDEFLGLDLSAAVLSKKPLGPETQFAPYPVEASTERAQVRAEPKATARVAVARKRVEPRVEPRVAQARGAGRAALARRHSNPLDAQARDTRIQTWPCKSGGICGWQR